MYRRLLALSFVTGLVFSLAGCPNDGLPPAVNIAGMTDQQAADHVADTLCGYVSTCGAPSFECSSTPDGNPQCTGDLSFTSYNECYQELQTEVLEDFESVELTAAQERTVNQCINDMVAMPCMTQAELDEVVAAMNRGEDVEYAQTPPASCFAMDEIFHDGPVYGSGGREPTPAE